MTDFQPSRRIVFQGLGALGVAAVLAGCGGGGGDDDGGSSADTLDTGTELAATADVPVGGGVVLTDEKIVIAQPTEGDFKAFSAVCTHQGTTLDEVQSEGIHCPNHGSLFSVEDGSAVQGPATKALPEVKIKVDGDKILAAYSAAPGWRGRCAVTTVRAAHDWKRPRLADADAGSREDLSRRAPGGRRRGECGLLRARLRLAAASLGARGDLRRRCRGGQRPLRARLSPHHGGLVVYLWVDDLDDALVRLAEAGAEVVAVPASTRGSAPRFSGTRAATCSGSTRSRRADADIARTG